MFILSDVSTKQRGGVLNSLVKGIQRGLSAPGTEVHTLSIPSVHHGDISQVEGVMCNGYH